MIVRPVLQETCSKLQAPQAGLRDLPSRAAFGSNRPPSRQAYLSLGNTAKRPAFLQGNRRDKRQSSPFAPKKRADRPLPLALPEGAGGVESSVGGRGSATADRFLPEQSAWRFKRGGGVWRRSSWRWRRQPHGRRPTSRSNWKSRSGKAASIASARAWTCRAR